MSVRLFTRQIQGSGFVRSFAALRPQPVFGATYARFQSTKLSKQEINEDLDEWLDAVKQLRLEFTDPSNPYNPSTSLAPPGSGKIDISSLPLNEFKPSAEQLEEFEALKQKKIPLPKDELLDFCTTLIMKHGKKARAETLLARALYIVKLQLRVDPVEALRKILEDMAPLMVVKTFKNGTAKAVHSPMPLFRRQRTRYAFTWILKGASKRQNKNFSVRLGEELVAAYNGKSEGFNKRAQMHADAITVRSYVKL